MRAFFALPIPEPTAHQLLTLVPPIRQLRRVKPASLHLTLHFLPKAPATLATDLTLPALPPSFTLTPTRLLLLPESGPIRLLAATLAPSPPLQSLHATLTQELHRLNQPTDPRRYLPHITLARADPPLPQQVRAQSAREAREDMTFQATALHLIESRPTPVGFEYVTLQTWHLP